MGVTRATMGDMPDAAAVQEAFQFFDKDGDELLTKEEFTKMVQSLGQTPTKAKLSELLDQYAPNGTVNKDACDKMMPEIAKEKKSKQDVIDAFKVFDNRSDGHITVDNFRQMMGNVGEKLTAPEVQEAVAKALEVARGQTDGQEAIDYVAYVDWMMGKDAK